MKIKPYSAKKILCNSCIKQLVIIDQCSSTLDALEPWLEYKEPTLILAEQQKKGRGQRQRNWISPAFSGIWGTLIIKENTTALSIKAAIALAITLENFGCNGPIEIKWPNDLYLNGKKTAGILVEGINKGQQQLWAIGIGITYIDIGLAESMPLIENWPNAVARETLISQWIAEIFKLMHAKNIEVIFEKYDYLKGKIIHNGIASGINSNGNLLIKEENGNIKVLN